MLSTATQEETAAYAMVTGSLSQTT